MTTPQQPDDRERFDAWANDHRPVEHGDYPDIHAAGIDWCFPPPDGGGDVWLDRIFRLRAYVAAQPCTCIEDECERCRLLNIHGAGR